jgi:FkbM family methyltransferase
VTFYADVHINGRWWMSLPDFRALRYLQAGPLGWERERIASMHVNLGPHDVLLDVGAESGDMTALFARWVHSVVMVEPNPVAWPNARAIFDRNGLSAPTAHWVGFTSDTTTSPAPPVTEPFGHGWPACATGDPVAAHGTKHLAVTLDVVTIPRITLDDLVDRLDDPPTAVTMDIEGAELAALSGARRFLTEHRPLLWVSVHPGQLRQHFRETPAAVYELLESYDYRIHHLADDHETHIMAEPR